MPYITGTTRTTNYIGTRAPRPINANSQPRDPTPWDNQGYLLLDEWLNTLTNVTWKLISLKGNSMSNGYYAQWVKLSTGGDTGTVSSLTGDNTGVMVMPISGNINIIADTAILNSGSSVSILGNNSDATLVLNVTDSNDNTIIGNLAGKIGITGAENTGLGASSLSSLTTGSNNTALGYAAGADLSTGSNNILIGQDAGENLTTGSNNTLIGINSAAGLLTGSHNIFLGPTVGASALSGQMVLGDFSNTVATYVAGVSGVIVSNENLVTINTVTGQLGSISGSGSGTVTGLTTDDGHTVTPTAGVIIIHGTSGITTSGTIGPNTVTISGSGVVDTVPYTAVTNAMSPYTVLGTDYYLGCNVTAGVITILLPNAPATGRVFIAKDNAGLAATSNITVTTVGGAVTIDGATSFVMNTAYESVNVIFNGTSYEVW